MKKSIALFITLILLSVYFWLNPEVAEPEYFIRKFNKDIASANNDSIVSQTDLNDEETIQNSLHLKFKNVAIDGTLDKFVARMEQDGFKKEHKTNGQAVLSGDFADFKACMIYVHTLKGKDLVSKIEVHFSEQTQWEPLHDDYIHLKELLTLKYGKPSACVEKFQGVELLHSLDNGLKMNLVGLDHCQYETRFEIDKGEITLRIGHEAIHKAFVMLTYKDRINGNVIKEHAIEEL